MARAARRFCHWSRWGESLDAACLIEKGALVSAGSRLVVIRDGRIARVLSLPSAGQITALRVSSGGAIWAAVLAEAGNTTRIGMLSTDGAVETVFEISGMVADLAFGDPDSLFATVPASLSIYLFELPRSRKRRFSDIPRGTGMPVALAADADSGLWAAMADGWSILRFDRDGNVARTIALPVPYPTGLCFGGPALSELFVTSRRIGLTRESLAATPLSGHGLSIDLHQGN